MMGSEQKNALFAVILSGLILFGWQTYFAQKSAPIEPPQTSSSPGETNTSGDAIVNTAPNNNVQNTQLQSGSIEPVRKLDTIKINANGASVHFDNQLTIKDFENSQAAFSFVNIVENDAPLGIEFDFGVGFQKLYFTDNGTQDGVRFLENKTHDLKVFVKILENSSLHFELSSSKSFRYRFLFKSQKKNLENGQIRKYSYFTDQLNTEDVGEEDSGDRLIKWAGIDFNYHLFALNFPKEEDLLYSMSKLDQTFTLQTNTKVKSIEYNLFFVKKEYDYLTSLGNQLNKSVDFGVIGFFAVWILRGLQFFYSFFPNYGLSIILLTLLVRTLTFPLQYKSLVSMKKLQLIQPEISKIREKYKDDPMRVQKETMELFKRHGASPLGGCLPLILQMPVFFAFYKVLHSAVELVDAPFVLWIHDLSNKDPYYIIPVLMSFAMLLQQKLTPNTTTDPTQKKVMMFMPLIFGVFMKDLPSGLTLYIFVSTLFGIIQQGYVIKFKSPANTAK